jgi:NUBPL iron-transfer P-loop NTPase
LPPHGQPIYANLFPIHDMFYCVCIYACIYIRCHHTDNGHGHGHWTRGHYRIRASCPEIMDLFLQAPLFQPTGTASVATGNGTTTTATTTATATATPESMANKFGVPYLGKLPMDPNMMNACEQGVSFLQAYTNSIAAPAFARIVDQVVEKTKEQANGGSGVVSAGVEMET